MVIHIYSFTDIVELYSLESSKRADEGHNGSDLRNVFFQAPASWSSCWSLSGNWAHVFFGEKIFDIFNIFNIFDIFDIFDIYIYIRYIYICVCVFIYHIDIPVASFCLEEAAHHCGFTQRQGEGLATTEFLRRFWGRLDNSPVVKFARRLVEIRRETAQNWFYPLVI
jgi:hypothetical protein